MQHQISISALTKTFPGFVWYSRDLELCGWNPKTNQFISIDDGMCINEDDDSWVVSIYQLKEDDPIPYTTSYKHWYSNTKFFEGRVRFSSYIDAEGLASNDSKINNHNATDARELSNVTQPKFEIGDKVIVIYWDMLKYGYFNIIGQDSDNPQFFYVRSEEWGVYRVNVNWLTHYEHLKKNMSKQDYIKIGESKILDGQVVIKPDYYDDGLAFGNIFKDEEIYQNNWGAVCFVPEYAFEDVEPDEDGFYKVTGYSHNDLFNLCAGNRELCDWIFHDKLVWAFPETYLNELSDEDMAYFYRFITPGAKVWWNDPAGKTSGKYTVLKVPFEFDEQGESIKPETFASDAIILIGNEVSEAEVTPFELTPINEHIHILNTQTKS